MNGTLYIVGVGPGDPELLTLKAVRIIRSADVIAYPSKEDNASTAYHIVEQALPEVSKKELLPLYFPMIRKDLHNEHRTIVSEIQAKLQNGKNVALLTLGDPGFYSTPYHLLDLLLQDGCPVEVISGVASFSAASASRGRPMFPPRYTRPPRLSAARRSISAARVAVVVLPSLPVTASSRAGQREQKSAVSLDR